MDVDYPRLMSKKRDFILTSSLFRESLLGEKSCMPEPPVLLQNKRYVALGCDLRDLELLEKVLKRELDITNRSVLFVAEVSITYMGVEEADSLVRWASSFSDARFCLLEQYLPDGPGHPFAQTMIRHFEKLGTPLQGISKYPRLQDQHRRFVDAGWPAVHVQTLWQLWANSEYISQDQRLALDLVEPFDEWEEFALFSGHYFLLVARNSPGGVEQVDVTPTNDGALDDTFWNNIPSTHNSPELESSYAACFGQDSGSRRRFGAAFTTGHGIVTCHGGLGAQTRLTTADSYSKTRIESNKGSKLLEGPPTKEAYMCHTITTINNKYALMVGGRTSPNHANSDCWYFEDGIWKPAEALEPARFRHCAVQVRVAHEDSATEGILIFGGKTSSGLILDEWRIWEPNRGWCHVPCKGGRPPARYGASMAAFGEPMTATTRGVLTGGMTSDGRLISDIWEWELRSDQGIVIFCNDRSKHISPICAELSYPRFGANLVPFGKDLLLIGGVTKNRIISVKEELLIIRLRQSIEVERLDLLSNSRPRPLLVGSCAVSISDHEVFLVGGGAVCFSMGSFWNLGFFEIAERDGKSLWHRTLTNEKEGFCKSGNSMSRATKGRKTENLSKELSSEQLPKPPSPKTIQRIRIKSPDDFLDLLRVSEPAVLEGLDIGPCVHLWSPEYLEEMIGSDRSVVVHSCTTDRMTFQEKNFSYIKKPFGEFIWGVARGEKCYLRTLSASQPTRQPTKLGEDFPGISQDFILPPLLVPVAENMHSSPLRVSGPVTLWLHYDVLANVLCQIRGTKTIRLYPPSDVTYLDFPPGGSSSNIDVFAAEDAALEKTHPYDANLSPGDILFIPPMWPHTATPTDGMSVAVNVFFHNLDHGYAPGKDVYGNRDLQAYENGRRDVERIFMSFQGLPVDVGRFYLERLAAELEAKAKSFGI